MAPLVSRGPGVPLLRLRMKGRGAAAGSPDRVDAETYTCFGTRGLWLFPLALECVSTPPMQTDPSDLREQVRAVYSRVAAQPAARHPFTVGRGLAVRAGYPEEWLSKIPAPSVDSFAGVSCLPSFADPPADAQVLDLGCGAGLDSLLTAPKVRSVIGIDFSEEMLNVARDSARAMAIANVEFRVGDAERIPVDPGSCDAAVVNGIFNLNQARSEIFRELARVVRLGGMIYAAELILKAPLPSGVEPSREDWFG